MLGFVLLHPTYVLLLGFAALHLTYVLLLGFAALHPNYVLLLGFVALHPTYSDLQLMLGFATVHPTYSDLKLSSKFMNAQTESSITPSCEVNHPLQGEKLSTYLEAVLPVEKSQRMAEFFSFLGDPNRLRILSLLAQQELCVCDLAESLGMSESAVSHQLRNLRTMRLVGYEKRGRKVFYHLADHHVLELYQAVAEHLDEKFHPSNPS